MINKLCLIHPSHSSPGFGVQALEHLELEKVTKEILSLLDIELLLPPHPDWDIPHSTPSMMEVIAFYFACI